MCKDRIVTEEKKQRGLKGKGSEEEEGVDRKNAGRGGRKWEEG